MSSKPGTENPHTAAEAVKMLDLLIEFFGELGHRWNSSIPSDKYGGRCLTNALESRLARQGIPAEAPSLGYPALASRHGLRTGIRALLKSLVSRETTVRP
jgi:hypothetical protein